MKKNTHATQARLNTRHFLENQTSSFRHKTCCNIAFSHLRACEKLCWECPQGITFTCILNFRTVKFHKRHSNKQTRNTHHTHTQIKTNQTKTKPEVKWWPRGSSEAADEMLFSVASSMILNQILLNRHSFCIW